MIEIGELKDGDIVLLPEEGIGTVYAIEYSQAIDDEWEKVTVALQDRPRLVEFYTPTKQIKKFPFKVGDRVKIIERSIFDMLLKNGDCGIITDVDATGAVKIVFDKLPNRKQVCNFPEEHLRKIEEKGEEEMRNIKTTIMNWSKEVCVIDDKKCRAAIYKGFNDGLKSAGIFNSVGPVVIEKVIFNEPAVILYANGQKYVSKAYNQEFDPEVGLMMCLIKAFGISYLDLKRLIATVKKEEKKVEEKKNVVKVNKKVIKEESVAMDTTHLIEEVGPRIDVVSPKGKKRGKPFNFFVGDEVIVRDCDRYSYTTNSNAKQRLDAVWKIQQDNSDYTGTCYVVNGCEFSGSELEPFKK